MGPNPGTWDGHTAGCTGVWGFAVFPNPQHLLWPPPDFPGSLGQRGREHRRVPGTLP